MATPPPPCPRCQTPQVLRDCNHMFCGECDKLTYSPNPNVENAACNICGVVSALSSTRPNDTHDDLVEAQQQRQNSLVPLSFSKVVIIHGEDARFGTAAAAMATQLQGSCDEVFQFPVEVVWAAMANNNNPDLNQALDHLSTGSIGDLKQALLLYTGHGCLLKARPHATFSDQGNKYAVDLFPPDTWGAIVSDSCLLESTSSAPAATNEVVRAETLGDAAFFQAAIGNYGYDSWLTQAVTQALAVGEADPMILLLDETRDIGQTVDWVFMGPNPVKLILRKSAASVPVTAAQGGAAA